MQINSINSMNFKGNSAYAEHPQINVAPETIAVLDKLADTGYLKTIFLQNFVHTVLLFLNIP